MTSTKITSNTAGTDIATYNTFVQNLAAAGHADIRAYSSVFRVVGCTAAVDARDNTSTTYTSTAKGDSIYWLNGNKVVDNYEDFYDGSWDDEANDRNEFGTDAWDTRQSDNFPMTGCNHDGTESFLGDTSRAIGTSLVRVGTPNLTQNSGDGPIRSSQSHQGSVDKPMYALSGVLRVNDAPMFGANTADRDVDENTAANTNIGEPIPAATDGDGDTLTYTMEGTDAASFTFDASTRQIRTSAALDFETTSEYSVTIKVSDGTEIATVAVTLAVNNVDEPPVLENAIPDRLAPAGTSFSYVFPTDTFSDPEGDTLSYAATKADGTALPTWLSFVDGSRTFSGTPQLADLGTVSVKVTASDGNGGSVSDEFVITVTTVAGAPTSLSATASGTSRIDLSWTAPVSNGGSAITGYRIESSPDGASNWTDVAANTNGTTTTYAHTGLAPGTSRHYQVSAINAAGVGAASNVANATTVLAIVSIEPLTQHLQIPEDIGEAVLTVSLDRPAGSVLSVPWFTRDESAEAPSDYTAREETLTFAAGETRKTISVPIVDDGVREDQVNGAYEYFYVNLRSGQGYSLGSVSFVIVEIVDNDGDAPPDVTPPLLTRATVNGTTLVLTYNETLDGASTPTPADFVVTAAGSTTTVNRVSVGGSAVTLTLATAVQADQAVTLDYTPGANPTQDEAGNDAAPLSGQAMTNNTSGGGGGGGGGGGTGGPSMPGAPASLRAIPGDREVELAWSAPEDDGGAPVIGYQYRVLEPDGGVHTDWTDIPDGPDPDVSASDKRRYTVTGLTNGSKYAFDVRAVTEGGAGEAPRAVATPAGAPDAPASLTATEGDGEVVLEWTRLRTTAGRL